MNSAELDEHVLVFPANLLNQIGAFQGLAFNPNKYLDLILTRENHRFMRRSDAEEDFSYKQLIPYVIFYHNNKILSYQRGVLLSEERLLHNHSIGIGGHISVNDPNLFTTTYEEGMYREVHEEVYIDSEYTDKIVALLNDDSNEVGKVHFGVIHILILQKPLIRKREKSINKPQFLSVEALKRSIDMYENWSKICIADIEQLLSRAGFQNVKKGASI